jgi:Ner family transcriptional regulator
MDALEIAYRLRLLGKRQTDIAKELGISPQVVHRVIGGQITAHAVATYIAHLVGSTPAQLWPGRYVFKPRASSVKNIGTSKTPRRIA